MPAPTPLEIATNALTRLLKEETMYEKELVVEEAKLNEKEALFKEGKLEGADENTEYMLKQQRTNIEQTKNVFEPLRKKIEAAHEKLTDEVAKARENGATDQELEKALDALQKGEGKQVNGGQVN